MKNGSAAVERSLLSSLIEARRALRLTQGDLARRLGVQQQCISRIENGQRKVTVVEYLELADALSIDPVALLDRLRASGRFVEVGEPVAPAAMSPR